ncbi:MAG TPA: hypothetical protein VMD59_12130, partial [Acidimicrobiales bacterium]|nr:hypothetical protein [Acidimicrobiales bacterium]
MLVTHFGQLAVADTDVIFVLRNSAWTHPSLITDAQAGLVASGLFDGVSGALDAGGTRLPPSWLAAAYRSLGPPQDLPPTAPAALGNDAAAYDAYRATAEVVSADGRTIQFRVALAAGAPGTTAAMQAVPAGRAATGRVAARLGALEWGVAGEARHLPLPAAVSSAMVATGTTVTSAGLVL